MDKQKPWRWVILPPLCLLVLLAGIERVHAEPKTAAPGGEAIKKAQGLIRQLSQEKQALEAEKAAWASEKATLDAKIKSLEAAVSQLAPLQGEVVRYKAGLEAVKTSLEAQLGQQRQREQALLQKHNDVVKQARAIRDDNQLLVQAVQEREQWISQCSETNQKLQSASRQAIQRYQQKGLLQELAELDPITGIGQVETERVAEDYRYQLKQLQITPFQPAQPLQAQVTSPTEVDPNGLGDGTDAAALTTDPASTGQSAAQEAGR